jgi:hypothetical protein
MEGTLKIKSKDKSTGRANLSWLALISFVASFAIARIFTTISRNVVLRVGGFHIHHFLYGIILLAVGGWLGISYNEERITRVAAVLYGAGGGLIMDEAGLLLTFGNYWTGITYAIVVIFLASVFAIILFKRYSKTATAEIRSVIRSGASLYFGIILTAVSIAFLFRRNFLIVVISTATTAVGCIIIVAFITQLVMQRIRKRG